MRKANYSVLLKAKSDEDGVYAQMTFFRNGENISMYQLDYDDLEALIGTSAKLKDGLLELYQNKKAIDKFNEENQ